MRSTTRPAFQDILFKVYYSLFGHCWSKFSVQLINDTIFFFAAKLPTWIKLSLFPHIILMDCSKLKYSWDQIQGNRSEVHQINVEETKPVSVNWYLWSCVHSLSDRMNGRDPSFLGNMILEHNKKTHPSWNIYKEPKRTQISKTESPLSKRT